MPDNVTTLPARGPGVGHNVPPGLEDKAALDQRLPDQYKPQITRLAELELGVAKVPNPIANEHQARAALDWIAQQCRPAIATLEKAHKDEKADYLAASRTLDAFFLHRLQKFKLVIAPVEQRIAAFHKKRQEEQRREEARQRLAAQEEQRKAAAEAHRLAEEAAAAERANKRQAAASLTTQAQEAEARAAEAQFQAEMPPAPTTLHGDHGASAFTTAKWKWEVEDPQKIPLGYLMVCAEAVDAAIAEGIREIPGLRIFETESFRIRRC